MVDGLSTYLCSFRVQCTHLESLIPWRSIFRFRETPFRGV